MKQSPKTNYKQQVTSLDSTVVQRQIFAKKYKSGEIKNVKIAQSVDPFLDKEAIRVVSNHGVYTSGKHRGIPVPFRFKVPVTFSLP